MRLLIMSVALTAGLARAQLPPVDPESASLQELSKLSLEEFLNLELTASSKAAKPISEAPSTASVVTRQTIRDYGWLSIQEILSRQPGFYLGREVERPTVSTRGMYENWNNNHLALLIDGVPFNDPFNASALTWEPTPIFLIESLEVIRGPGSALYGSSAVNGVVAINSIEAPKNGATRAEAAARVGTFGRQMYDVLAGVDTALASMVVSYNFSRDAGSRYFAPDLSGRTDSEGNLRRFQVEDGQGSSYLFAKIEGKKALKGFSLQLHRQEWTNGLFLGAIVVAPDSKDSLDYARSILSAAYRSPKDHHFRQEYVFQIQRLELAYNTQILPAGAFGGFYPGGVSETVGAQGDAVFGRAQLTYQPSADSFSLIGGAEYSSLYTTSQDHFLNVDLGNLDPATGLPLPLPSLQRAGSTLQLVKGGPPRRIGVFAQATSGRILKRAVELTAGVRYDSTRFKYRDDTNLADPIQGRSYDQLTPRVSLVGFPSERLSLKLMAGRAFREPSVAETFLRNSFLGFGNPLLKPETINSYELAADWRPTPSLTARANGYIYQLNNLVTYDTQNVARNLFSRRTAGIELELLGTHELGHAGTLAGFASYSFTTLLTESSADPAVYTASPDRLAAVPAQTAKMGVDWRFHTLSLNLQAAYQGRVSRSPNAANLAFATLRPDGVAAWTQIDAMVSYRPFRWLTGRIKVTDLFNSRGNLVAAQAVPFDYRLPGRRIMGYLEVSL